MQVKEHKLSNYHKRALAVADNSHDSETKVGAILINKDSGAVIADGCNGFCRHSDDSKLPSTRPDKYPYMIHAEINLICNAVRHGISTDNCFIYCTLSPCINCIRTLWQCGISLIYCKDIYKDMQDSVDMLDLQIMRSSITVDGELYYKIDVNVRN